MYKITEETYTVSTLFDDLLLIDGRLSFSENKNLKD